MAKQTLLNIIQEVSAAADVNHALRIVVEQTKTALQTDAVSIFLTDHEQGEHVLMATEGLNKALIGKVRLKWGEGLVGLIARREQPVNLADAPQHPSFHYMPELGEENFHAYFGVPIIHQRQLLGVLVAQEQQPRRFDEEEGAFLITLAAQLAGAIAHAQATGLLTEIKRGKAKNAALPGLPGAPGVAIGKAVVIYPLADLAAIPERESENIKADIRAFQHALQAVQKQIRNLSKNLAKLVSEEEYALFNVYLKILSSRSFSREVKVAIRAGQWAQGALKQVIERHVQHFEALDDSYLKERAADLRDLGQRILFQLQASARKKRPTFPARTILVGEEILPSMLAEVPEGRLAGVVSVQGSSNSHMAVLARALNIPAVMGVTELPVAQVEQQEIIVDGYEGQIFISPTRILRREFSELMKEEKEIDAELQAFKPFPAQTLDGHSVSLFINLGLMADLQRSLTAGADGAGLYRTEVPFMLGDRFPSEEEQSIIYRQILEAFAPRPVMMRTLDVGGDKALPYFPIMEDNPFLGWRGIRITLDHPEIFFVQLRAMLRAAIGFNNLQIMLPMVSSIAEVEEAVNLIRQAQDDLRQEGLEVADPAVGVMVEVPAAVYQSQTLAQYVDFLSVGSNDLTQYLLAVDRNNPRVANLFDHLHPAVLRALLHIVEGGHRENKHVSICGEMAGDPIAIPLLLAMGFDSLSMSSTRLLRAKYVIRSFSIDYCRQLLKEVLTMKHSAEVRHFLELALEEAGLGNLIRVGGK